MCLATHTTLIFFLGIRRNEIESTGRCAPGPAADAGRPFLGLTEPAQGSEMPLGLLAPATPRKGLFDFLGIRPIQPGRAHVEPDAQGQKASEDLQE